MVSRPPRSDPAVLLGPGAADLRRSTESALGRDDAPRAMVPVLRDAARLLDADRCTLLTPLGPSRLRIFASSDETAAGDFLVALDRYPELAHLLESGEPVLVPDVGSSELLNPVRELVAASGTTSLVAVPVKLQDITGILRMTSAGRSFGPPDLERLRATAQVIEGAVRRQARPEPGSRPWRQLVGAFADVVVEVLPDGRISEVHRGQPGGIADAFRGSEGRMLTELLEDPEASGPSWLSELLAGRTPRRGRALAARVDSTSAVPVRAVSCLLDQIPPRVLVAIRCAGRDALDGDRVFIASPLPMLAVDGSGTVVLANRAAEEIFGGSWHQLVGRRRDDLIREWRGESLLVRVDGHHVPVGAVRTAAGDPSVGRLSIVAIDSRGPAEAVGSREQHEASLAAQVEIEALRRQVEELSTRRTLFLSAWAHELKTPLTVLQVYLETLRDDLADGMSDEQMSFVGICHDSVLRLRRLVTDLVDLAALDNGKLCLQIDRVELVPLLERAIEESRPLADRAGLELELEADGSPVVRADHDRLLQVVLNLLHNAIKFTDAGGGVTVRAGGRGDAAEIAVSDSGIGIPADRQAAIFEEFVRFQPSTVDPGSGLGLSISRRLVEALGGEITVTSEVGVGSTFTVRLPASRASG